MEVGAEAAVVCVVTRWVIIVFASLVFPDAPGWKGPGVSTNALVTGGDGGELGCIIVLTISILVGVNVECNSGGCVRTGTVMLTVRGDGAVLITLPVFFVLIGCKWGV